MGRVWSMLDVSPISVLGFVRSYMRGEVMFAKALITYFFLGCIWVACTEFSQVFALARNEAGVYALSLEELIAVQGALFLFWPIPIGLWRCCRGFKVTSVLGRIVSAKDCLVLSVFHFVYVRSFLS